MANLIRHFAGARILLLQGPMGPFFWRLRGCFQASGAQVFKVNFCGGDALFYPRGAVDFSGSTHDWPDFLTRFIDTHGIDTVMMFGDCRNLHAAAREVAKSRGLETYVFEEGYLRPDFVTVERGGVNNYSSLPRDPDVYRRFSLRPVFSRRPMRVRRVFRHAALYAILYCLAMKFMSWRYPLYRHHRTLHPVHEGFVWCRAALRKLYYQRKERGVARELVATQRGNYFLVPLQVNGDAQIRFHSDFSSVSEFIETVVKSFAEQAPGERLLVFKHHPLDRGYNDYSALLAELAASYGLQDRLLYVHDLHLPSLLRAACGTVVINSTVGLTSVHHGTPVCVLGDAAYNMPGLTHQGALNDFWSQPAKPESAVYRGFKAWLRIHNQANGNFYSPLPQFASSGGIEWPVLVARSSTTADATLQIDEVDRAAAAM